MAVSRKHHRTHGSSDDIPGGLPAHLPTGVGGFSASTPEVIKLILHTLHDLGLHNAASVLEHDSGVEPDPTVEACKSLKSAVCDGRWEEAVGLVRESRADNRDLAELLLLRQWYLELLEAGTAWDGLVLLRGQLTPLAAAVSSAAPEPAVDVPPHDLAGHVSASAREAATSTDAETAWKPSSLHALAALALCSQPTALYAASGWPGAAQSRPQLFKAVWEALDMGAAPDGRLLHLLGQAVQAQTAACVYHNTVQRSPSLLVDHACSQAELPRRCAAVLDGHTGEVWGLQFSPCGKWLATHDSDGDIKLWDIGPLVDPAGPDDPVITCACTLTLPESSPDTDGGVYTLAWSPDGSQLAAGYGSGCVAVWKPERRDLLAAWEVHYGPVTAVAWVSEPSPSGRLGIVSGGEDGNLHLHTLSHPSLRRWPVGRVTDIAVASGRPSEVVVLVKYSRVAFIKAFEGSVSTVVPRSAAATPAVSVAVDAKGQQLLLSSRDVVLWDRAAADVVQTFTGRTQKQFVTAVTFGGPDDRFIASGSHDCGVFVWHRDTPSHLLDLRGHAAHVNAVAWNAAFPTVVASASDDGTARIWVP